MADPQQPDRTDPPHREQRSIDSVELFQDRRSIVIVHSGEQYRLMITRNDKLILQK